MALVMLGKKSLLVRLYKSSDGAHFEVLVERLFDRGEPNESSIVFLEDGTAFCLLRRDGKEENSAQLGTSPPPYTEWTWKDLGLRLGGPDLLHLPDGRWVATGRLYENGRGDQGRTMVDFPVVAGPGAGQAHGISRASFWRRHKLSRAGISQ